MNFRQMCRKDSDTSKCIPQKYTPGLLCTLFQVARLNSSAAMILSSVVDPAEPSVTGLDLSNQNWPSDQAEGRSKRIRRKAALAASTDLYEALHSLAKESGV